ncbi:hypothetical protein BDDG_03874 [Blastomyces dermatitidis ATCC 18188]|uniref:Uncharacterized protein n=1 Tax=Ajellomyces dermatitidis (strain ATCC 18188 / CBS 674.68) TaxID=653446 RepID=F2TCH0_AJEDA|nr:hypothetical protein BDDG_03874 [Blastomyces dermatitidis ATCC 18188]
MASPDEENDYTIEEVIAHLPRPISHPDTTPCPPSYLRAIANRFTPKKLSRSLQNGPPIFLIGPAMIPNVLKHIISAHPALDVAQDMAAATLHAHTLYCVRPLSNSTAAAAPDMPYIVPVQRCCAGTLTPTPTGTLTTVTGLAVFNLTDLQRAYLRQFESAPFKRLVPVCITICLSTGKCVTIDAGAFVEVIRTTEEAGAYVPATTTITPATATATATTPFNWLLTKAMQQYRCETWDVATFTASALYKQVSRAFEVWDAENGAAVGDGVGQEERGDEYGYDDAELDFGFDYLYEYDEGEEGGGEVLIVSDGEGEEEEEEEEEEVDSEWERDEVEEVDGDEIEIEGGIEGEGRGWGNATGVGAGVGGMRVGMGVGVGRCQAEESMWEKWMTGFRRCFGDL